MECSQTANPRLTPGSPGIASAAPAPKVLGAEEGALHGTATESATNAPIAKHIAAMLTTSIMMRRNVTTTDNTRDGGLVMSVRSSK